MLLLVGCNEQIVHNLSEGEANRLLSRLHDASIDARKDRQADGKWMIGVPADATVAAIKILDTSRLLRSEEGSQDAGTSLVMSKEEQRLRSERLMSGGIERTISSLQGVLEAHVHLNLPVNDPLFGYRLQNGAGSASVLVVAEDAGLVNRADVVALVSGAAGIETKAISVVVSSSKESSRSASPRNRNEGDALTVDDLVAPFGRNWMVPLACALILLACLLALLLWRGAHKHGTTA